jgi:hypothetical protein
LSYWVDDLLIDKSTYRIPNRFICSAAAEIMKENEYQKNERKKIVVK